jgi:hypothetical protein
MRYTQIIQPWLFISFCFLFCACTEKPKIIEQKCSTCHSSSYVYKEKRSIDEWDRLLIGMKARGLKLTPKEETTLRNILSKNYSVD